MAAPLRPASAPRWSSPTLHVKFHNFCCELALKLHKIWLEQDYKTIANATWVMSRRLRHPEEITSFMNSSQMLHEINVKHPSSPGNVPPLSKRCFVNNLITAVAHGFIAGLFWLPKVTHVCKNLQTARARSKWYAPIKQGKKQNNMLGEMVLSHVLNFSAQPLIVYMCKHRLRLWLRW